MSAINLLSSSDVTNLVCPIFSTNYGLHIGAYSSHRLQSSECQKSSEVCPLSTFIDGTHQRFYFRIVAEMWIGYLRLCHNHSVIGLDNIPSDGPGNKLETKQQGSLKVLCQD